MKSQTTKDVLGLAMHKDCVGVLLLTGTPMKNGKPSNLFPLLKIIKHDLGKHEKKYEERYCNGQYKQFGRGPKIWDAGGKSNEEELKDLMGDYMLRKTKEECLDLKEKVREFKKVEVTKKAWIDYKLAVMDLKKTHESNDGRASDDNAIRGALQRVSQVCSISKVDAAIDVAIEVLKEKEAVVIFTGFVKTAETLVRKFKEVSEEQIDELGICRFAINLLRVCCGRGRSSRMFKLSDKSYYTTLSLLRNSNSRSPHHRSTILSQN